MSARYPNLDDVRDISEALAPGLSPWNEGDCFIAVGREMLYVSLRVRIARAQLQDSRTVLRNFAVEPDARPRSQTIRSGFIGSDLVRFDWGGAGGLLVVGSNPNLESSTQLTLDFMARRGA
ncbi:hypothetical protein [Nesterenkonia flava]|uniref:Bacterial Pleckstrin homology domain-containing protein n=1 Tax=Nesterenkonia flava TaxID=469799 RepID=A0ABU1FT94_9MICC|nr:hypothetical protein [Nesterenkonia flava]MDR5711393.1 hypothetical protein [Nesterenkonia flava]